MNYDKPELRDRLASEYVLGTLTSRAQRRMERLLIESADYRQAVRSYSRLNNLVELLPPVSPSPNVWARIRRRTFASNVSTMPERRRPRARAAWSGWAAAAMLMVALVVSYLGVFPTQPAGETYVVVITDDAQSKASWVIGADPVRTKVSVKALNPQSLPPQKAFQLWMKVAGENKVRSVGLIPASGQSSLSVSDAIFSHLDKAEKFGVSIEQPGGSPTGQPTTTPLYHGKVLSI